MAAEDDSLDLRAALQLYDSELQRAVAQQQQQLDQLRGTLQQLQDTGQLVQELPNKLQHQVMVPCGKHAFFPGHLVHTNELLLHLGSSYYAECTAAHVGSVLNRRQQTMSEGIQKAEKQLEALTSRQQMQQTVLADALLPSIEEGEEGQDAEGVADIRQSLEDSDAMLAAATSSAAASSSSSTPSKAGSSSRHKAAGTAAVGLPGTTTAASSSTEQQQQQQQQRKLYTEEEYAALMQRFAELELLEAQQGGGQEEEQATGEGRPPLGLPQQQQQPKQQPGQLNQEGVSGSRRRSSGDGASRRVSWADDAGHSIVQHREGDPPQQQRPQVADLEQEPDSDDDDDEEEEEEEGARQQQRAPSSSTAAAIDSNPGSQQQQQSKPKPILRKGFLDAKPSKAANKQSTAPQRSAVTSRPASTAPAPPEQPPAFTGLVLERAPPIAETLSSAYQQPPAAQPPRQPSASPVVGSSAAVASRGSPVVQAAVVERAVQPGPSSGSSGLGQQLGGSGDEPVAAKRPSKFLLQRRGHTDM